MKVKDVIKSLKLITEHKLWATRGQRTTGWKRYLCGTGRLGCILQGNVGFKRVVTVCTRHSVWLVDGTNVLRDVAVVSEMKPLGTCH